MIGDRHAPQRFRWIRYRDYQPSAITACCQRLVALDAEADTPRASTLDVEAVEPRAGPIRSRGEIEQRSPVQERRIAYPRVVRGNAFGNPAGRVDPPDVHLVWRRAVDKVNEGVVRRPHRKMAMKSGRPCEDLPLGSPGAVIHKQRVARRRRVIDETRTIARPVELRSSFEVELWLATDIRGFRGAEPTGPQRYECGVR